MAWPWDNGCGLAGHNKEVDSTIRIQSMDIGDLRPECGEATVANEEGYRKC
jgi:hypothetical protein